MARFVERAADCLVVLERFDILDVTDVASQRVRAK
jgi:hypothetical protein